MGKKDSKDQPSAVDQTARDEIEKLRSRFEGAELVPRYSVIFRKALNSTLGWPGWEATGIFSGILLSISILFGAIFFIGTCSADHNQEMRERRAGSEVKQFRPACEALGLEYLSIQKIQIINNGSEGGCDDNTCPSIVETITCVGEDRVVTVNARDITETKVQMLKE